MSEPFYKRYEQLPAAVRQRASAPGVIAELGKLEEKYEVELAELVMRYVVGDVTQADVSNELLAAGVSIDDLEEAELSFSEKIIGKVATPTKAKQSKPQSAKSVPVVLSGDMAKSLPSDQRVAKLEEQYKSFVSSGPVMAVSGQLETSGEVVDHDAAKQGLYRAINSNDQRQFLVSLARLFASGKLAELFRHDERYIAFWRERILKSRGLEVVNKFDQNPARPEHLGNFIRYVLEHRFKMSKSHSPLWGAYLAALARAAGDEAYQHLAHGDVEKGKFVWQL